jgi:D-alanyl-D-alanine carboxypeptidase (penicillin-binding protein 5/6)
VTAASAIVMDADSGKVLFQKNADVPRFPASTTKIMTGLLLVENVLPDTQIVAPSDVDVITGSKMHLKPGEKVPAKDMLYALMLRSANDGCYAVALHVSGSIPAFSKLMNQRAQQIGCTHTNFNNPNGLNDPRHLTTAHDLALIAREAMKYPEFQDAVKTTRYAIRRSINQKDLLMVNKDKLLLSDPTAEGIKTGWTIPAGKCFVGSATRDGYRLITVVLKSEDWKKDTTTLWNWGFANHERELVKSASEPLQTVDVKDGEEDKVEVMPSRDIYLTVPRGETVPFEVTVKAEDVEAPVALGQRVATIIVTDSQGGKMYVPALAAKDIPRRSLMAAATSGVYPWLGLTLVGGTLYVRGKSRRTRTYGSRRSKKRTA